MIKLVLQNTGLDGDIYIAWRHIVAIQPSQVGCLVTTTRSAFHVKQAAHQVLQLVNEQEAEQ